MDRRAMSVPTPPIRSAGMIHSRSPAEARPSRKAVGQVPYPTDRFLMFSAPGGIRTPDLRYRKPALYPLSYGGEQMNIDKPSAPGGSPCQRKVSAANCRSIDSKSTNAGGGSRCRSQTHTSESYASTSDTMNCSFRGHRSFSCAAILLLFQRRIDSGEWEIPAGSAEPGQSFTETAITEVQEEIGLSVQAEDLIPFATFSDPVEHRLLYPNGDVVHAFALCFVTEKWSGQPSSGEDEVSEWAFHPLNAPPEPLRRSTKHVLELYEKFFRTGSFQAD